MVRGAMGTMVRGTSRTLDPAGEIFRGDGSARTGSRKGWRRRLGALATLTAWLAMTAGTALARDPDPPVRIPLEPLGFQTLASGFLLAGSPMLTVDFVDKDHLLITFGVRRLMKREPDPPPDDDDRTVAAVLVELPSGKVLARTEWRLHDRWQYLWNLGHGRFLLRVRDSLTILEPMEAANRDEALGETPILRVLRHIVAVMVSSNGDLLTVETTKGPVARSGLGAAANNPEEPGPVQINFYRLAESEHRFLVSGAGAILARAPLVLPMTTAGFLDVLEGSKNAWMFNFDEHAGKVDELAEWNTSCFPHATFVGHAEFVAFGCRGSDDRHQLAGFNLKGEEMWQQNLLESYVSPTFAFAPTAGRFALGRTLVSTESDSILAESLVRTQEVRVYQSYDGRQLFRIECSPVERAGQNFALSGDGLQLAVVREATVHHAATKDYGAYTEVSTAVEVYPLPPLEDKDQAEVKKAEAQAPVDSGARIDASLTRIAAPADAARDGGSGAGNPAASPAAAAQGPAGTGTAEAGTAGTVSAQTGTAQTGTANTVEGDAEPRGPSEQRTPPTLYGPAEGPAEKPADTTPK